MTAIDDCELLDDLVARVNLRARITFRGQLCERWAIGGGAQARLGFHIVLSGRSWLRLTDQQTPIELGAGGMYLYRPEECHLLSDTALAERESPPARIVALAERVEGARVGLLCGYFEGGPADAPVVDAVPAYLLWRRREDFPEPLARLMGALVACAHDDVRGGGQVLERLCELLMRMILREPQVLRIDRLGFLRAQRDPALRRVFDAIHARPGRPWTLTTLARSAGISRSALAARFKEQAGIPAMHYLRRYRVQLGERRMHEDGWSAKQVARALGYHSVSAFRRAARRS